MAYAWWGSLHNHTCELMKIVVKMATADLSNKQQLRSVRESAEEERVNGSLRNHYKFFII